LSACLYLLIGQGPAGPLPGRGPELLGAIERTVLGSVEQKRESRMDQLLLLLMSGFAVLCLDGCGEALT